MVLAEVTLVSRMARLVEPKEGAKVAEIPTTAWPSATTTTEVPPASRLLAPWRMSAWYARKTTQRRITTRKGKEHDYPQRRSRTQILLNQRVRGLLRRWAQIFWIRLPRLHRRMCQMFRRQYPVKYCSQTMNIETLGFGLQSNPVCA